jgi:phosphopantothenoylcysteine decarboxylase/phosphopantothenate--cysteine ligase
MSDPSRPATGIDGPLSGRTIILGVTGSIAAYKAVEVLRLLVKSGADVHVMLTAGAQEFVAPLTFQVLSGHRVTTSTFDEPEPEWTATPPTTRSPASDAQARLTDAADNGAESTTDPDAETVWSPVGHIDLATRADAVLVAPATANVLGKLAHGIADDALTTLLLAVRCPVICAPAMNTAMYAHPAVQANRTLLESRGCIFVEPEAGELACRTVGTGRLAAPEAIFEATIRAFRRPTLSGRTILVTAGRTEEPLDPVRVLTNRSSGKMGYALAAAARDRGARVVLVSGVASVPPPSGVEVQTVRTAAEMAAASRQAAQQADVVIMAAAVSDYHLAAPSTGKIERESGGLTLRLEATEDILASIGRTKGDRVLVGFALETGSESDDLTRARAKLQRKNCDLIVLNNPSAPGAAIGGDTNVVTLMSADGTVDRLPCLPKLTVADRILDRVERLMRKTPVGSADKA